MKRVMDGFTWQGNYINGRKKPLYYRCVTERVLRSQIGVYVLGHYDSACGGCDNIGSAAAVYELVYKVIDNRVESVAAHHNKYVILCEGLLLSEDTKWSSQLPELTVHYLTTPLETCISQIKSRRLEAGNTKPLNTKNTTNRFGVIERSRKKLLDMGIHCVRGTVNQTVQRITDQVLKSCQS